MKLVLACLLSSSLLVACEGGAKAPGPPPPTKVELAPVALSDIKETSEYVATLKSRHSVTLQPQVDGQIVGIRVKSGDLVKAGALLMQIDPRRQTHTVSSQRATADSKLAALNYAKEEAKRIETVFQSGAASQQERDQANSQLASAQADFDALGAQVRESQVQLDYFSITAPETGAVGDIPVREGDYVTSQTKLTTIDQNEQLELYVSVPVERASDLRNGMLVQLLGNDGQTLADSHVSFISSQVDQETQSILVKTIVDNLQHTLRTAQFVRARMVWNQHRGPSLPTTAIKRLNGQTFAFVAVEQGGALVAQQRPVALGPVNGNSFPVVSGVKEGEQVVVSGLQKLSDGSPLQRAADAKVATASATPADK